MIWKIRFAFEIVLRFPMCYGRKISMTWIFTPLCDAYFQKHNGAFLRQIGVYKNFSGPQISYWSVVGWSVVDCRLVGGFKKTHKNSISYLCILLQTFNFIQFKTQTLTSKVLAWKVFTCEVLLIFLATQYGKN